MTAARPARTHDLLRLRSPDALIADTGVPSWVTRALSRCPWVVVRRGHMRGNLLPVGVRGAERSERFAAFILPEAIDECVAPEDLAASLAGVDERRRGLVPSLRALSRIAPLLTGASHCWGPGGSVAFELASGTPATSVTSDLDVVIRRERRLEVSEARHLLDDLAGVASPTRVDVVLETPHGGVLLNDLVTSPHRVLVRTADGPRLSIDPWSDDAGHTFCPLEDSP